MRKQTPNLTWETVQIRRQSLTEQVATQIQQLIIDGGYAPGDRIPTERELCEQLSVSRTVIREGIKALQERGLVRVVPGSGTYISKVEGNHVSRSISLFFRGNNYAFRDLLEIRKSLEVEIAGLAALRATESEIQDLESAVHKMRTLLEDVPLSTDSLEEFAQADLQFHQSLARASHNSLLPLLLTPITDLVLEFSREASTELGAPENAVHFHQEILECVRKRDSATSRDVMRAHISNAEELLHRMQDHDKPTPVPQIQPNLNPS